MFFYFNHIGCTTCDVMKISELKIQFASDLHLEFPENQDFLEKFPIKPVGEVLILAGDIVPLVSLNKFNSFFDHLSHSFEKVFWIPGNHEYYHYDLGSKCGSFKEKIRENIWFLNNQEIIHKNYRLIFSTLWSHISPQNILPIQQNLNDFRFIKFNGKPFTPKTFNTLYEQNRKFIENRLQQKNNFSSIVVTHHVPTFLNYPEQYKNSRLNEAFTVELYDLILTEQPDYWVYGHHHFNTTDFKIENCRLLTNQLGYVAYNEHRNFVLDKTIPFSAE